MSSQSDAARAWTAARGAAAAVARSFLQWKASSSSFFLSSSSLLSSMRCEFSRPDWALGPAE
eukprot:CAMPEP_0119417258 /NCGR_PEP_ID=MMETSP1335-20130426/15315_1 /TAXON_ID=259385 /ORGANISM="Chrysoculter rhomboideus, Strain RCC1486" /LENGTH=61 /DNA_ID=CAMNT_0007442425 /DNA_START=303 /DNA_END=485 /DNA_ORIENTATION=-